MRRPSHKTTLISPSLLFSSHIQIIAEATTGISEGMKITARQIICPGIRALSSSASPRVAITRGPATGA